jgi:two-component system phosphate regulon sensor histidine kinase PhoR
MNNHQGQNSKLDLLFQARDQVEDLTRRFISEQVTLQTSVEAQVKWLTAILDSAGDGLFVVDGDLRIVLVNEKAARLAGCDLENLSRAEWRKRYKFIPLGEKEPVSPDQEPLELAMREKRSVEVEGLVTGYLLPPDGVWIRVKAAPILDADGTAIGGVTVFSDISKRITAQKQRDTLAALITHDLKNYLAAESMLAEELLLQAPAKFETEEIQLINELSQASSRYLEIVSTLLEIFRTGIFKDEFEMEAIDTASLLESVVALSHHAAKLKSIEIKLDATEPMPALHGVPYALKQVFHNVLQNAINASRIGEAVTIRVSQTDSAVLIEIVDTGKGFAADNLSELFRQSSSSNSTGFGLYLTRLLVETHKGTISCKSDPGKQTTFSIYLPKAS